MKKVVVCMHHYDLLMKKHKKGSVFWKKTEVIKGTTFNCSFCNR